MVQQRHQHVAGEHGELVMEVIDPRRGLLRVGRAPDGVQHRRQRLQGAQVHLLQNQAQAQTLQGVPNLQQRADLVSAQRAPVIAHDGDEGLHAALPAVVADVDALPGNDVHEAELLQFDEAGGDDRARHAHLQGELPGGRKLLPDGKLSGENHMLDLLHEKIRQRGGGNLCITHGKTSRMYLVIPIATRTSLWSPC